MSARTLSLVGIVCLAACSGDRTPTQPAATDATEAAQQFDHLADSVAAINGSAVAAPYRGMADLVRQAGKVSAITLRIRDEDVAFDAVAQETILSGSFPCPVPPIAISSPDGKMPPLCPVQYPAVTRSLIAWQPKNPARLVQLLAVAEQGPVGYNPVAASPPAPPGNSLVLPATLQYFDGNHGLWWATSGTQSNSMTLGGACPTPPASSTHKSDATPPVCTQATFTWQFDASVGPYPIAMRDNTAKGTLVIKLAKTTGIAGAQVQITAPPPPQPPAPQPASPLKGAVTAKLDNGALAITLTVTNPTNDAVTVTFPSGQTYDFWVVEKSSGKEVWRWSIGKAFTAAVSTKSIPAKGTLTYTERWTPSVHGTVVVHGVLTGRPSAGGDVSVTLQ